MIEAQIVGDLGYLLVKHWVAGKAKNVVGIAVFFYPFHRLNAPVMTGAQRSQERTTCASLIQINVTPIA
jgi:hypothetical protein